MEHITFDPQTSMIPLIVGLTFLLVVVLATPIFSMSLTAHFKNLGGGRAKNARSAYIGLSFVVILISAMFSAYWLDIALTRGTIVVPFVLDEKIQLVLVIFLVGSVALALAAFIENRSQNAVIFAPSPDTTGVFLGRHDVEEVVQIAQSIAREAAEIDERIRLILKEKERLSQT